MLKFPFNRDKIAYYNRCLEKSLPIRPCGGRWTVLECLLLAGAARMAFGRNGPWPISQEDFDALHPEAKEVVAQRFSLDAMVAVDAVGHLAALSQFGGYSERFEPDVEILITIEDTEGKSTPAPAAPTLRSQFGRIVQFV